MGKIKVIISEEGTITIEAKEGFEGKSCQEAIDHIMNNLPTGFEFDELRQSDMVTSQLLQKMSPRLICKRSNPNKETVNIPLRGLNDPR